MSNESASLQNENDRNQSGSDALHTCIHCGQTVNDRGVDGQGSEVCGPSAADADMQDNLHDWDNGPA